MTEGYWYYRRRQTKDRYFFPCILSQELEEEYQRYLRNDKLIPYYSHALKCEFDFTNMTVLDVILNKIYFLERR